ncbi:NrfD/PsrC family molybdoenzyme membrane anchor subunit [Halorientalis salina]|uniref:NrfD/PsrC family molybdoenzyme membrane anchor subunit n=1 Tax=Halorientalis salina TaxID=2932266 RepID=UPI0010AB79FB|nr:NrfD/PsrC family molybdoenzyme membrane anchor subunit [Halorientalis salina]
MSTPSARKRLTEPFESTSKIYYGLVAVAVLLVLGMVYSFVTVLTEGHAITGLNNWGTDAGVPWGLDIGAFTWWALMGVGAIALSAIIRVFEMDDYEPYARVGELVTPLAFLASFLHIVFDLGQPFRVLNTLLYLPLESPIAWDVILLAGLGLLSVAYLIVSVRRDIHELHREDDVLPSVLAPVYDALLISYDDSRTDSDSRGLQWWLAAAVLVFIPVVGGGVVPFVWGPFGVNINWFGAIQGPTFLAGSMTVGAAALLFVAGVLRFAYGLDDVFTDETLRRLGVFTGAFAFTYLLGVFYEVQTGTFAADMADPNVSMLVFQGPLAPLLWLAVAAVVIPTIYLVGQQALGRFSLVGTVLFAGVMLVGVLHQETWLTVGGLMYPDLAYPVGEYTPSIYEWLNLMGTTALVGLGLLVFTKTLPVVTTNGVEET